MWVRFFQLILIFFIMNSVSVWGGTLWGDINGDEKIGLEEAVYALQVASGVKTARVNATHKGTIDTDEIWTPEGNPHIITDDITIAGPAPNGATLTIEPGTEIWFNRNTSIEVGYGTSPGTLIAKGTEISPILFTSNQTEKTKGWWHKISFNDQAVNCEMTYCTVEYGGAGYSWNQGNIVIEDTESISLNNCIITNSISSGIRFETYVASENLKDYVGFSNCMFSDNEEYGIYAKDPDQARWIHGNNKFTNNKLGGIYLNSSVNQTLTYNATWHKFDEPYILGHQMLRMEGAKQPTLTIEAGTELRFNADFKIEVRSGRLIAEGTQNEPVVFTSNQNFHTKGYWYGIHFYKDAVNCSLRYCTVEYAGSRNVGGEKGTGIYVATKNGVNIHNCNITNSEDYGIKIKSEYLEEDASADITGTSFSDNGNSDIYLYVCRDDVGSYTGTPSGSPSVYVYDCEAD